MTCFAGLFALVVAGCDVDVKDKGKPPKVNVSVERGRVPDIDVRGPDVEVKTQEKEITVPDVDVDVSTKKKTITVPDVDVRIPKENDNEVEADSAASK
jgi:hypothetical protein